jgi:hypothetical protein
MTGASSDETSFGARVAGFDDAGVAFVDGTAAFAGGGAASTVPGARESRARLILKKMTG